MTTVRDATTARRNDRAAVGWAWTGRNLILDEALVTPSVVKVNLAEKIIFFILRISAQRIHFYCVALILWITTG